MNKKKMITLLIGTAVARMKEAQKLVITTDLKTYEIAERVGYHNICQGL